MGHPLVSRCHYTRYVPGACCELARQNNSGRYRNSRSKASKAINPCPSAGTAQHGVMPSGVSWRLVSKRPSFEALHNGCCVPVGGSHRRDRLAPQPTSSIFDFGPLFVWPRHAFVPISRRARAKLRSLTYQQSPVVLPLTSTLPPRPLYEHSQCG